MEKREIISRYNSGSILMKSFYVKEFMYESTLYYENGDLWVKTLRNKEESIQKGYLPKNKIGDVLMCRKGEDFGFKINFKY